MNLAQMLISAAGIAAIFAMIGYGFVLIHRSAGYFDFSLCGLMSICPYLALLLAQHLPDVAAICVAATLTGCIALLMHITLFNYAVRRLSPDAIFVVSLGLTAVIVNVISILYGDTSRAFSVGRSSAWQVAGVTVPHAHGLALICLCCLVLALALLRHTPIGLQVRALIADRFIARDCGLPLDALVRLSYMAAGVMVGISGSLLALDLQLQPTLGLKFAGYGMAVALVGVYRFQSVLLVAMVLSTLRLLSGFVAGSSWEDSLPLIAVVVWFTARTRFGRSTRIAA
jgi:branched-chain amino acid transport system permease protein